MGICREDVAREAKAAFEEQYPRPRSRGKFIDAMVEKVMEHEAADIKARLGALATDTELMGIAFPNVATPAEINAEVSEDEEEGNAVDFDAVALRKAVYYSLLKTTWNSTTLYGPVQAGLAELNGLVLCRYGGPRGSSKAVYVTHDGDCIIKDVIDPEMTEEVNRVEKRSKFVRDVSRRNPAIADVLADAFDTKLKEVVAVGRSHIPALVEEYGADQDFQGINVEDPDEKDGDEK